METFHWDEHFTTGIASVDKQHLRLVNLINVLGESLIVGASQAPGSLHVAFEQLASYAQQHFQQEEALMVSEGLEPAYRMQHEHLHADFGRQLGVMWAARDVSPTTGEVLHGFLRAWLAMHILGEDQSMARQMKAMRAGKSANEAYRSEASSEDNATAALLIAIKSLYRVLTQQNNDLVNANRGLEARVLERTQALADANQRLETMSNTDALLGIANRRHFDTRLDAEWRRGAREHCPLSLLMIDVDHFKYYNDHYGHPAGDLCLQRLAWAAGTPPALKRPADLLARYGGEELVVLLPGTPAAGACAVAGEILRAISDLHIPHEASPVGPEVTVSVGVASAVPVQDAMPTTLLAAADAALYAAKAAGRNCIVVHG